MEDNNKNCTKKKTPGVSGFASLEETTSYKVGDKTFIVEPHFKDSGGETIAAILIKLMKSEGVSA